MIEGRLIRAVETKTRTAVEILAKIEEARCDAQDHWSNDTADGSPAADDTADVVFTWQEIDLIVVMISRAYGLEAHTSGLLDRTKGG